MSATVPAELPSTSNSPRWSTQDRSFGPASGSQTMLRLPRAPGPIRCPREPGPHPSKTRRMMKSSTSLFGISMRPMTPSSWVCGTPTPPTPRPSNIGMDSTRGEDEGANGPECDCPTSCVFSLQVPKITSITSYRWKRRYKPDKPDSSPVTLRARFPFRWQKKRVLLVASSSPVVLSFNRIRLRKESQDIPELPPFT